MTLRCAVLSPEQGLSFVDAETIDSYKSWRGNPYFVAGQIMEPDKSNYATTAAVCLDQYDESLMMFVDEDGFMKQLPWNPYASIFNAQGMPMGVVGVAVIFNMEKVMTKDGMDFKISDLTLDQANRMSAIF